MTFTDAIRTCFRKYITFSGRASRPEYWYFVLFIVLGGIVASAIDGALFRPAARVSDSSGPVSNIFSLVTFIPLLAAGWRRMHDTGRSGLYLLYPILVWVGIASFAAMTGVTGEVMSGNIGALYSGIVGIIMIVSILIAIFSPLIVIWWLTRPTQPGPNTYGSNPNEVPA
ncbi:DUF805 domain-containing protein [Pseudooceanicola onchidii]|uniref:DUF805 domain-containing protein n=1 Tax=Pseudooceanicola onchidii TaxID=2562279 RepID=UPI0010AB1109|nr:DUF805 domain-containing protein [Pseudooceanicola onchidii]